MKSDSTIACEIVRDILTEVVDCVDNDRSKVKLNMFERGAVKGLISEKAINGITNYINKMNPEDIKRVVDKIEYRLKERNDTSVNYLRFGGVKV